MHSYKETVVRLNYYEDTVRFKALRRVQAIQFEEYKMRVYTSDRVSRETRETFSPTNPILRPEGKYVTRNNETETREGKEESRKTPATSCFSALSPVPPAFRAAATSHGEPRIKSALACSVLPRVTEPGPGRIEFPARRPRRRRG